MAHAEHFGYGGALCNEGYTSVGKCNILTMDIAGDLGRSYPARAPHREHGGRNPVCVELSICGGRGPDRLSLREPL